MFLNIFFMFCKYIFFKNRFLYVCVTQRQCNINAESCYGLHGSDILSITWGCVIQSLNMEANISAWLPPTPASCMQGIPRRLSAAHSLGCCGIRDIQYLPRKAGIKTLTHSYRGHVLEKHIGSFSCYIILLYLDMDKILTI